MTTTPTSDANVIPACLLSSALTSGGSRGRTSPISVYFFITARKRSLGQGNVFTPVCHSVHQGVSVPACTTGHMTGGSLSRGSLSRGVSVQGVSVLGVSVWGVSVWGTSVQGDVQGGFCPGGLCPGGSLLGRPPIR